MVFIDVHCHLDFYDDKKIDAIMKRARKADVGIIVNNGVNKKANRKVLELAGKYPEIKVALGLYPLDALKLPDDEIDSEIKFIRENREKITAIGEVGMDFKKNEKMKRQGEIFQKIIELAIELNKPMIVHSRKAEREVIEMLEKNKMKKIVMHCFSGNFKMVGRIIENGWFLTIPTSVKNSEHFQKIIARAPLENLLCETYSPFLHSDKGRENEPANIIESYKKIAEIKNLGIGEVETKIGGNFRRMFD